MTKLISIFTGESARKQMEGATIEDITRIMSEVSPPEETSPFAQVLGYHLYTVEDELNKHLAVTKGFYKKKKR